MVNIILFGAPGCGKGTQAARLAEHYDLYHISTGEVIRSEIKRGTELGKSMEGYISRGELAPDNIVVEMVRDYMRTHSDKGCIFDGFPRTTAQAEIFDTLLKEMNSKVDVMVYLDVPEEELIKRILLRGKDSGRADDASEDVIRNRIEVYREQTAIVAHHYAAQDKYAEIDGLGTFDEVFHRLTEVIDEHHK
ncbi:MAG: adenylate kinase [Alistipes sp.]|nr:adenylate kinase [Alistipes sp.]